MTWRNPRPMTFEDLDTLMVPDAHTKTSRTLGEFLESLGVKIQYNRDGKDDGEGKITLSKV